MVEFVVRGNAMAALIVIGAVWLALPGLLARLGGAEDDDATAASTG